MKIRRAEDRDTARIMELLRQVNNVHSDVRPDLFLRDKTKYTEDELHEIMQHEDLPIFVAVDANDRVLGYMFGKLESHVKDNNFPDITTFYIDDLCVDEASRGQHVGKALYEHTVQYAKAIGCYNLTLNVWEGNTNAQAFYDACGLKPLKIGLETVL